MISCTMLGCLNHCATSVDARQPLYMVSVCWIQKFVTELGMYVTCRLVLDVRRGTHRAASA